MRLRFQLLAALTGVVVAVAAAPSAAQESIARAYTMVPKDGMAAQFATALKSHLQWRVDNGDPWTWGASTVEVGENVGEFAVRSSGHSWDDLDSYDAGFGPDGLTHFTATVTPLLESVSSTITAANEAISNRPPQGSPLGFVMITRFNIRPDQQTEFGEAIAAASLALKGSDWSGYWIWETPIAGGGNGPYARVVGLHENWASMQEPDPPMLSVLEEAMGRNDYERWLDKFGQSIRGQVVTVYRLRPDLNAS